MRFLLLLLPILCSGISSVQCQIYDPLHPPNTFQNADNPHYWKNDRPTRDYWQQDVHYRIDARIDEEEDIIEGKMELTYWNNSPDTLEEAFFHLYQNAFQPGSYYDKKRGGRPSYGQHGSEGRGTLVDSIRVNGEKVKAEIDNTILRVKLPEGLEEGEKMNFAMRFRTHFDEKGTWRRMDLFRTRDGHKHYNGVHWYPRISVYDRRSGWTTDQHLGKEFYGDFGTFDVSLDFPSNFIVQATGNLINREKVLPDSLRQKLDLSNFKDKEWNSPSSTVIPYDSSERKTWRFHAENVHDFAFTADPTYRIDTVEWNGITCMALVQEPHASGWKNAAEVTADAVKTFSKDIGPYGHHKIIVADARSGMEYPMLTLCGGKDPGYRGLLVHEIAHNWFFGMVGTNETYRAAMDEGFTQFLTAHGLEAMDGDTLVQDTPDNFYRKAFSEPESTREKEVYMGYLRAALRKDDAVINTHSDHFESYNKYRQVYYKTSTMLYNLQYVLGDSLYWDAMQNYFKEWSFAHPYFEDFRRSVIQRTDQDLNWFFDQWWNTQERIDYGIKKVRNLGGDRYRIVLERKGEMQMPIDLRVVGNDGKKKDFHIPNKWFVKETDAKVLDRWIGWGKEFEDTYSFKVKVPGGIEEVIIDPSGRLADIDRRDNRKSCPVELEFDAGIPEMSDLQNYEVKWRPALWYNGLDGIQAGIHSKGDYMDYKGRYRASIWGNTRLLQQEELPSEIAEDAASFISYDIDYRTGTEQWIEGSELGLASRWNAGLSRHQVQWGVELPSGNDRLDISFTALQRPKEAHASYLLEGLDWGSDPNRYMKLSYQHSYGYSSGKGVLTGEIRSQALSPEYDMSWARFRAENRTSLAGFSLRSRLFAQYGTGRKLPPESMLYLAGASPERMMEDPLTRAKGFIPGQATGYGARTKNFHYGGGLGLRGYSGYLAPSLHEEKDTTFVGSRGISGAAVNLELEFQEATGIRLPRLGRYFDMASYLFMDAGLMDLNPKGKRSVWGPVRMDAGLGLSLTLERAGPVQEIEPVTFRFDMPFFLNRTPAEDPKFFQYRWMFGISRGF